MPNSQKVVVDGSFADWDQSEVISTPANAVTGYTMYGTVQDGVYYLGIDGISTTDLAVGAGTTIWLNTDGNRTTGYNLWGGTNVGAEYNITFDATGTPYLYTGAAGQTQVSTTPLSFALSSDGKSLEIAIPASIITPVGGTAPKSISLAAQVTDAAAAGATTYLPGDYTSSPQYTITDTGTLLTKVDTHRVAIVYSDTSAGLYFNQTAYSDLFMAAQNQARMAGVSFNVIDESQLTNVANLVKYDALIFPAMPDVNTASLPAIVTALTSAVYDYHISLITSGDFLTNDQTGAPLPGNAYSTMEALMNLQRVSGGNSGTVSLTAADTSNPITSSYSPGQVIQTYSNEGYTAYGTATGTADVLVNQNVTGVGTLPGVVETTTGANNVHFATQDMMGDSNLLSHAIQSLVLGTQPGLALHTSRQAGLFAARMDMDQSQFPSDVSPTNDAGVKQPGIYDKLVPILQQWKAAYNFVGSYYINIGNTPTAADPTTTNWATSLPYYQAMEALGGEIGNHSYTHLIDPPTQTITETTVGDTPAGSTQITLSGVPAFAGSTLGLIVSGTGIGSNVTLPGDGGAVANSQITAVSGNTVTISFVPGGYGTANDGTLADIPAGTTLTFSVPPENTNFLQTTGTVNDSAGSPFTYDYEFNQAKAAEAAALGHVIYGAAVPGATETYTTSQNIQQYYQSVAASGSNPGYTGYLTGGWTGIGSGYPSAIGYMNPTDTNSVYLAPNITFDFSEIQYEGKSVAQAEADWQSQLTQLGANAAGTPIVVWPIHDYGAAAWDTSDSGTTSPYTTQMFTDFIAAAYNQNYEFVTVEEAAARIAAQQKATINYTTNGNVITASATPDPTAPDLGSMALALVNGGTNVIQNVGNWYAYDTQQVFTPYGGGNYTVTLGATQDDLTHINVLPSRADLLSVTGDGTNLNFSMTGDGTVNVHLRSVPIDIVSIQGAPNATLTNGVLALTFADTLTGPSYTPLRHDVAIQEAATETASNLGEIVFGTAGNDVFFAPGSGTNQIHGNGGIDTIMFTAAATNYKVVTNADGSETITDLRAGTPDGIDTIYNIANLIFGGPTISSVAASGTGITNGTGAVATAATVTLTVNFTQAVTVAGAPTLTLNDGGTATYTSGSGSTALTFTYTVLAGQNTSALQVNSVNLPTGATITSALNQNATLTPVPALPGTLQVDTVVPVITGIATSGTGITNGTGSVAPGTVVTLTVTLSDAVKVTGGTPTLTLNNGGTASYTGGTGTTKLTFAYTVAIGQATPDLTIASLNLPTGTTIQNAAGTAATLTGATGYNPTGTLVVTTPATLSSISAITTSGTGITAGTGDLNAGKTVTLTATFSQAVTVKGTAPTMTLDDGGTAIYASGSGTTALTFTYVVKAGQNSADLLVKSLNLPTGTTITDAKGNNATLTAATNYNPAGTLQIDTTAATLSGVAATGTGITNGAGTVGAGAVVTLTATFSEAVLIGTTKPTLTLNDGGTATYISGSGTNALVFSYTVAAGQNTNDLTITGLTGSALTDGAGNALTMPGAAVNPPGVLKVAAVAPTITITSVAANNTVTLAKAQAGFAITGTSTGIESGQNVTVTIKNSAGTVVDTETVVDNGTTWTANVNSTVAIHLTNDNYTATATATNKAGTAVSATPKAFVVNEGNIPVMPTLTLASNALTVTAGGSIPLGVTATPGNGNDVISLTIKGLPSYEKIVAPGYTVSSTGSGTSYTWTVTGKAGQTISGESLSSSYTGTGHPVANLTITASSAAAGGQSGKTTAAQTLVMTDPPAASSGTYTITPTSTTVAAASPVTTTPTSMISTAPATTTAKTDLTTLFALGTDGIKLLDSAVPSTGTSTAAYIPPVPTATALSAMGLFQTADAQTLIPTP